MTTKHSPTPWRVVSTPRAVVVDVNGFSVDVGRDQQPETNAAHIVACVNAHPALVAALEACETRLSDVIAYHDARNNSVDDAVVAARDAARAALAATKRPP